MSCRNFLIKASIAKVIEGVPKQFVLLCKVLLSINWLNDVHWVGTEGKDLEKKPCSNHIAVDAQCEHAR